MGATSKQLDFTNVKEGGPKFNKKRVKAGDYAAKILKVEDARVKASGDFQYLFTIQLVKHPNALYPYYCQLEEKTLWKLRNLLVAAGKTVPKKKTKVDPNTVVGKIIGVTMEDSDYEGKEQSEVDAVFPAADLGEGEDDEADDSYDENDGEDEEDEEEEVELEEDEEVEEEVEDEEEGDEWDAITDRTELRRALKKVAPDITTSSKQTEDDIRDLIRAAIAGDDEEEVEDEEEEEEPEPPKKKAKAKAAPAKKSSKKKSSDISDDELEELDIDDM